MSIKPNYYLITSSGFFIIPALYGIYKGHRWLPLLSVLSATGSINYWINPTSPNLLLADKIISRSSVIVYSIYGLRTIDNAQMKLIFWLDIIAMAYTYNTSCQLYKGPYNHLWIPCHMMFHYFCILSQLLVL